MLTFSHAQETRFEPGASLAGPRPYAVYTGVLLVEPLTLVQGQELPERLSQDELLFSRR